MQIKEFLKSKLLVRLSIFLAVFGPATITAMADNDASGVATYSIAGATLGYPILFFLVLTTIMLGVTQEMGIRLALITRKGLGGIIREHFGIKISLIIFASLLIANMGIIIVDFAAVKTTSHMLNIPTAPSIIFMVIIAALFVTKGSYKTNQSIFLISTLLYLAYIFSAIKARPDWNLALSNLIIPHGVQFTPEYMRNYIIIGLGVLGATITPWGQFFISSFAYDKRIEAAKLKYSQFEAYFGAFLTDFFSFFMVVATAATLYAHNIILESGEQAAIAIKPFAGELAGTLFAIGILNAGFIGIIIVSLSTAYAFSEFFGFTRSLNTSFERGKIFYSIFFIQLVIAALISLIPSISLFQIVIMAQILNAMTLPVIFYYLIKLTNKEEIMGKYVNNSFQKYFATIGTVVIFCASVFAIVAVIFKL
ncbi:MAG: hypothetical protein A2857_05900 [Candidatus Levybacteria bacterium RIFCSPHIGHO2_01_FULL_36_15]|nr:MAG: hypothetical protein A2857_05900 [Candidatus Levybacteria bacterium RIFCSPHIGHO2_01_FULL_36_15]OGH38427.1 MAG: hypothetical protein A2905_00700 [Candidatus Levybacteria bacterium RIFCSPLOWO2_01_FULL_36_10]